MDPGAHIVAIEAHAEAMAAALEGGRHQPVAACPGWDVADLAVHMGRVFRWAAHIVRTRAPERLGGDWTFDPDDPALGRWLRDGAAELVSVLSDTDPDTPVWTMGLPRTARFWSRRQALESLIHRWDAEDAALGEAQPLDPELAADGIGELLEVFVPYLHRRGGAVGAGETFHVHRTDGPGEWFVRFAPEGVEVSAEHAKADVALRGPAGDLLLVLWRRRPPEAVEVFGDAPALARWFELVPAL